ncbi:uncharacterized protein LOC134181390 [Corticium candelabrum]|uniref:uncharacterized protein LOC134181390 n=1 Tax=Corticium candelabrum TaxID=121492 RepID=UPI002E25AB0F|nr:uncharacterized protein LOC134181390 [Corticium candelabrum]
MGTRASSVSLRWLWARTSSGQPGGISQPRRLDLALLPRQLLKAGSAGVACGLVIRCYRKQPKESKRIMYYSLASAAASTVIGGVYAVAARRHNTASFIYSFPLSAGVSAAVVTAVFLSCRTVLCHREVIADVTERWNVSSYFHLSYRLSVASGVVTGFFVSAFTFQRARDVLFTCMLGGCLGIVGQLSYDAINAWRRKKAMELYYQDGVESVNLVASECVDSDVAVRDDETGGRVWGQSIVKMAESKSYAGQLREKICKLEDAIQVEQDVIDELCSRIDQQTDFLEYQTTGE